MKLFNYKKILIIIAAIIPISFFLYWGNTSIQINKIIISNKKIPSAFDGYNIIQVSDLHNRKFGTHQSKLLDKIKSEQPNIVVITGDIMDRHDDSIEFAMEFIDGVVKIAPVYYVSGNHESWLIDYDRFCGELTKRGVTILKNKSIELTIGESSILLNGVDDPYMSFDYDLDDSEIMHRTLSNLDINAEKFNILLSHRPELIDVYAHYNYDLVFTGHAHGGQVRIPFVGGVFAPHQGLFPKYTSGVYSKENTLQVVSRGLGNPPKTIRVFNRPEIISCRLRCV